MMSGRTLHVWFVQSSPPREVPIREALQAFDRLPEGSTLVKASKGCQEIFLVAPRSNVLHTGLKPSTVDLHESVQFIERPLPPPALGCVHLFSAQEVSRMESKSELPLHEVLCTAAKKAAQEYASRGDASACEDILRARVFVAHYFDRDTQGDFQIVLRLASNEEDLQVLGAQEQAAIATQPTKENKRKRNKKKAKDSSVQPQKTIEDTKEMERMMATMFKEMEEMKKRNSAVLEKNKVLIEDNKAVKEDNKVLKDKLEKADEENEKMKNQNSVVLANNKVLIEDNKDFKEKLENSDAEGNKKLQKFKTECYEKLKTSHAELNAEWNDKFENRVCGMQDMEYLQIFRRFTHTRGEKSAKKNFFF